MVILGQARSHFPIEAVFGFFDMQIIREPGVVTVNYGEEDARALLCRSQVSGLAMLHQLVVSTGIETVGFSI